MDLSDRLREEGRIEGERELVVKQLRLRFGDVPESVAAHIRAAGPRQLEHWVERVVTAPTLDELRGDALRPLRPARSTRREGERDPHDVIARLMDAAGPEATEIPAMVEMLREEGRIKGERKMLVTQLRLRFGDLSRDAVARVRAAEPEQLGRWVERVVTARSVDEALREGEATEETMTLADMLREGSLRGEREGEQKILAVQLRVRFGDLSQSVAARLRAAEPAQLERWAERVLTAGTLDEVLG